MRAIIIIGAGGHGQVVGDVLQRMQEQGAGLQPIGYLDDNPALTGASLLGLPVLGLVARLSQIPHDALIVAIGDNQTRRQVFERLQGQGESFAVACHPKAVIAPDVCIQPGAVICGGVVVNTGSTIGANVILNTGCSVDHHNHIQDHAHLAPGVHLGGEVAIGQGAFVGIGAVVIPRCRVGAWSMVGAGAVVNHDVPDGVVAVGAPARVVREPQKGS